MWWRTAAMDGVADEGWCGDGVLAGMMWRDGIGRGDVVGGRVRHGQTGPTARRKRRLGFIREKWRGRTYL